jgi:hypothetical protein
MPNQIDNQENLTQSPSTGSKRRLIIGVVAVFIIVATAVLVINSRRLPGESPALPQPVTDNSETVTGQSPKPAVRVGPPGSLTLKAETAAVQGEELEVSINIDTQGNNITAAEANLLFDPLVLKFKEVSYAKTVLSLKAVEAIAASNIHIVRGAPGDGDPSDSDDGFTSQGWLAAVVFEVIGGSGQETAISLLPGNSRLILDDRLGTVLEMTLNDLSLVVE